MSEYLFNWLPIHTLLCIVLFGLSLVLLLGLERKGGTGKFRVWILGISFWLVGMLFDALKAVPGWEILRVAEHLFQLGGSIIIAYAAYEANGRLKHGTQSPGEAA